MVFELLVLFSNFGTRTVDDGQAGTSGGFYARKHVIAQHLACTFDPAVDEVVLPQVDEHERGLADGEIHVDLTTLEIFLPAGYTDGCAVLVVSDFQKLGNHGGHGGHGE
tara:strand:- start:1148 stop:1474 length:327 start_codon:yes stop_codon:yes gene_type:complete